MSASTNKLASLLKKELLDKEAYNGWQTSIAICFQDAYEHKTRKKKYVSKKDLHTIANDAAKQFLNVWLKD